VLADEVRAVRAARAQGLDHRRRRRRVAQSHRDVAQPALVTQAADRRTFGALQELLLGPREQLRQAGTVEPVAGLEVGFGRGRRELVPGTDQLAVVAAEHAVADRRAQFLGDRALVLDREVGDAPARVEAVRRGDRLRRTDLDAAHARAAVRAGRRVD